MRASRAAYFAQYRRDHAALGLCTWCNAVRTPGSSAFCLRHLKSNRRTSRRIRGSKPWKPGGRGKAPLVGT